MMNMVIIAVKQSPGYEGNESLPLEIWNLNGSWNISHDNMLCVNDVEFFLLLFD